MPQDHVNHQHGEDQQESQSFDRSLEGLSGSLKGGADRGRKGFISRFWTACVAAPSEARGPG